jgi:hypothetical protein
MYVTPKIRHLHSMLFRNNAAVSFKFLTSKHHCFLVFLSYCNIIAYEKLQKMNNIPPQSRPKNHEIGDDAVLEPSVRSHMREVPMNYNEVGELIHRRGDIALSNIVQKTKIVIDVRTCAMVEGSVKEGSAVTHGEKEKHAFYKQSCDFPDTVKLIPFAIDTHGRWGKEFAEFLTGYCKAAAGTNHAFYNLLITRVRNTVQVAHAVGIGNIIRKSMDECVSSADRFTLAGRRVVSRQV